MNLLLEKKRQAPEDVLQLISMLKSLDHLTVTVVAASTAEPRDSGTSQGSCAGVVATSVPEDDFANATWEDAEWQ